MCNLPLLRHKRGAVHTEFGLAEGADVRLLEGLCVFLCKLLHTDWSVKWLEQKCDDRNKKTHSVFNTKEHKAPEILSASLIKSKLWKWCLIPGVCWRILLNGLISTTSHPATFSMILIKTQPILFATFRGYSQFLHSKCQLITCISSWRLPFKSFTKNF